MRKDEAHRLLDRARAGERIAPHVITAALIATGDAPEVTAEEAQQYRTPVGAWERRNVSLFGPASWIDPII